MFLPDYDTFETVIDSQFTKFAPGATVEVRKTLMCSGRDQSSRGDL